MVIFQSPQNTPNTDLNISADKSVKAQNAVAKDEQTKPSKRLISLDAFRGLTIAGMLLVNNVALDTETPRQLTHAPWNKGIHFADLVFPWFLYIVGVAIPYAAASHSKKGLSHWQYYQKAFYRMLALVLLGCFLDSSIAKAPILDLGVLQLIGLSYLIAALLNRFSPSFKAAVAISLLLIYWFLIRFTPVPGIGTGVFAEDKNIINYINNVYLAQYHLNGLLSVIPASALVLLGSLTGSFLRRTQQPTIYTPVYLVGVGTVLAVLGWIWNLDLPFNKPVWTPSYIVFTAGLGAVVLGIMYLIIDVMKWRAWAFPLVVFGMNAIAAYIMPIIAKIYILWQWQWMMPNGSSLSLQLAALHYFIIQFGKVMGGWIYTVSFMLLWWMVLLVMYKKKIFFRV